MSSSKSVYHHLIPQTYMKPWCFNEQSIWTYNKNKKESKISNTENICGINYFHSIRAGSLYAPKNSINQIWSSIAGYRVLYNGEELDTPEKMNTSFSEIDNWEIFYPSTGTKVKKADRNVLKQKIQQVKDNDIEEQWSVQFENNWCDLSQTLFQGLKAIKAKRPISLTTKAASDVMKYFIMFDWRGFVGNALFNDVIDSIDNTFPFSETEIPKEHRKHSLHTTALEEMRHNLIIKTFNEFLAGHGAMQTQLQAYEEHLTFVFKIAPTQSPFITSDNPSFIFLNKDGEKEPLLIALPNLAICLAQKDPESPLGYGIMELSDVQVFEYNEAVFQNAKTLVMSNTEIKSDYPYLLE